MECKSVRETGYDVLVRVIFIAHTHTIAMNKYRFKLEAKAKKKNVFIDPFSMGSRKICEYCGAGPLIVVVSCVWP